MESAFRLMSVGALSAVVAGSLLLSAAMPAGANPDLALGEQV